MSKFRDLSISRKLIGITMATTMVALALSSILFLQYDRTSFRQHMIGSLETLVETLNPNLTNALALSDRRTADGLLKALATDHNIISATVFDRDGQIFGQYVRENGAPDSERMAVGDKGYLLEPNALIFSRPMQFGDESIGTFQLRSDLTEIEERLATFGTITASVFVVAALIAFVLASYLQRSISRPIKALADVAGVVSEKNDYTMRVEETSRDEIGRLVHAFNHMLTQIQIQHEQVRVAKDRAEYANESKSTFLANMSHELRTPLNAIIGYSELLQEEAEDEGLDEFVPDLAKIVSAGKHLLSLINQVLDLSKVEAGKMDLFLEEVAIEGLLGEVASTIKPLVDKNDNRLEVVVAPDIGDMRADETKVRQILFNLLSNACKFTEKGTISLIARASGSWIELTIRDNGIGMTQEQLDRIFQPFAQADSSTTRKYGGTGLGLAICKQFAELMGGDIDVESEYRKGSTFRIRLPRMVVEPHERGGDDTAEAPLAGVAATGNAHANGRQALVIDDDPTVHDVLGHILGKRGFRVIGEVDPRRGLERARAAPPDVVLLDVKMPVMDGWQVLAEFKKDSQLKELPVIMVTVLDEKKKAFALGAKDFLSKPIDRDRVIRVLDQVRRGRSNGAPLALILEDDDATREILVRNVTSEGWEVAQAVNGREGLLAMARRIPDLILLDLMMPVMDGFEFLLELRKNDAWRYVPIVVLTAMDLGPAQRAQLNGRVEKVMEKGTYTLEELERELHDLTAR